MEDIGDVRGVSRAAVADVLDSVHRKLDRAGLPRPKFIPGGPEHAPGPLDPIGAALLRHSGRKPSRPWRGELASGEPKPS